MVYIDHRLLLCGLQVLSLYPNAMIERVEVISDGAVIRACTTWFIERMTRGSVVLQPFNPFDRRFTC